jgi:hypothetical protein
MVGPIKTHMFGMINDTCALGIYMLFSDNLALFMLSI